MTLLIPYLHSSQTARLYMNSRLCLYKAVDLFEQGLSANPSKAHDPLHQEQIVGLVFDCLSATELCPREYQEEMMSVIEQVLRRDPMHEKAKYCFAKYTALAGNKMDFLENCCKQFPNNHLFWEIKADMLCFARRWEEALPNLLRALELAPESPSLFYTLATVYKHLDDTPPKPGRQTPKAGQHKYTREAIRHYTIFLNKCEPDHRKRPKGTRTYWCDVINFHLQPTME